MRLDDTEINRLLDQVTDRLKELLTSTGKTDPLIIGIHTGGYWMRNVYVSVWAGMFHWAS